MHAAFVYAFNFLTLNTFFFNLDMSVSKNFLKLLVPQYKKII